MNENTKKLRRALKFSESNICKIIGLDFYNPKKVLDNKNIRGIESWISDICEKHRWLLEIISEHRATLVNIITNHGWWKKYEF